MIKGSNKKEVTIKYIEYKGVVFNTYEELVQRINRDLYNPLEEVEKN